MDQIGRFKLQGELGEGPYTVAFDAVAGRQRCVVKVLKEEAIPAEPARREGLIRALAGLRSVEHPSAVKVLEGGEEGGLIYIATEFMEYPTLEQRLAERGRLSDQQAVLFVRQSAQALDKARDLGYSHGDLVPRNVFVVSEEKIKLSDFAVRALIENPPESSQFQPADDEGTATEREWVTAEDLLRSKGKKAGDPNLEADFVGLAVLMMRMLGVNVPDREPRAPIGPYRETLLNTCYPKLAEGGGEVPAGDVVRRLLTAGGFDTPGEVVVELASAMLLGRSFARAAPKKPPYVSPSAETVRVEGDLEQELLGLAAEADRAMQALQEEKAVQEGIEPGKVTAFFIWKDRRSGTFFIVHDGEEISVGRDPDVSDVVLVDPAISRRHCILRTNGTSITVEDAGSSNGTFVNDERVKTAEVKKGDKLRLGTTRVYTFLPGQPQ